MIKQTYKSNNLLLADSLQGEQVRVLYSQVPASLFVSVLLAVILITAQSSVIDHKILFIWVSLLAIILTARMCLFIVWKHYYKQKDTIRWLWYFRISIITIGFVWALGGILLYDRGGLTYILYTSFALAGLCAGASSTLAIDRISVLGFMLPIQVLQIVFHLYHGDNISLGMGALWALYLIFLVSSAHQIRLKLEESYYIRQKASQSTNQLLRILESSPIATSIMDSEENKIVFSNKRYNQLLELSSKEVIGTNPTIYYARSEERAELAKSLNKGENIVNKQTEIRSQGERNWSKWVLASYFPIEHHERPAVLGWFYDITERKLMEDEIQYKANHDMLTGLPNRTLNRSLLKQMIATAKREKNKLAVMFIDLDKFKPINDNHGHSAGDQLLIMVADRIRGCLRQSDSAARIGGDEFVVLLSTITAENNAVMIAEKIREVLNQPFEIDGLSLSISSSIGISIYPDQADSVKTLTEKADIAMYYAKAGGRNMALVYQPEMKH